MAAIFTNVFGAIVGVAILAWTLWVGVTSSAQVRMERACAPVVWTGKMGVAFAMLGNSEERFVHSTKEWFEQANYGCQFTIWRVFWEDEWKEDQARRERERAEISRDAQAVPTPRPSVTPLAPGREP